MKLMLETLWKGLFGRRAPLAVPWGHRLSGADSVLGHRLSAAGANPSMGSAREQLLDSDPGGRHVSVALNVK